MKINKLTILASSLLASQAFSAPVVIAGGGGIDKGSTYSAVLGQFATVCNNENITYQEQKSSGGVENLRSVQDNLVPMAIVPSDLLYAARLDNATSVASIKTIVALFPEEVHLVARADVKKEGGVTVMGKNFGGQDIIYNKAEDLANRPIGAVGGSLVTAQILSSLLKLNLKVVPFEDNAKLMDALKNHTVDAAVFVAGQPQGLVAKLGPDFKLLPIRGNADTEKVYKSTKVTYANLNGGRSVDTLSEQALLVSRVFNSEKMLETLAYTRSCFLSNLDNIKDTTKTHPAWQRINGSDQGNWTWYDLPKSQSVVPETVAPAIKKK